MVHGPSAHGQNANALALALAASKSRAISMITDDDRLILTRGTTLWPWRGMTAQVVDGSHKRAAA